MAHPRFPAELSDAVANSNMTFLNIILGIVPLRMTHIEFYQVMKLEERWFDKRIALPLLAPFPSSWDGKHIADWLISAHVVNESRRKLISENFDGSFLMGENLGLLDEDRGFGREIFTELSAKVECIASLVCELYHESKEMLLIINRFFNFDFSNAPSEELLYGMLNHRYTDPLREEINLFKAFLPIKESDIAMQINRKDGVACVTNWDAYIRSQSYLRHICSYGRVQYQRDNESQGESPLEMLVRAEGHIANDILDGKMALEMVTGFVGPYEMGGPKRKKHETYRTSDYYSERSTKTDISKPLLALAALKRLFQDPLDFINKLEWDYDVADIHTAGRFAARILFLLCLPKPDISRLYTSVRSMFQNLLGFETLEAMEQNRDISELMDGSVCFSYFTPLPEIGNDPHRILRTLVRMNAALFTPKNISGVDLIIPVVLKTGELGGIFIEVKNYIGDIVYVKKVRDKLCKQLASQNLRRLNLIMNLNPCSCERLAIFGRRFKRTIILEGWKYTFGETIHRNPALECILRKFLLCVFDELTPGLRITGLSRTTEEFEL